MNNQLQLPLLPALVLAALLGSLGCHRPTPTSTSTPAGEVKPARVNLIAPEKRSLRRVVEQPGVLHADEITMLQGRIAGYVGAVKVDIGTRVKTGDVLVELRVPDLDRELEEKQAKQRQAEAEITQARRGLTAAEARADEMKAGISRAEATVERWRSENERVGALVTRGVIDQQTRDETTNQYRSAQAGLEEANSRVISAKAAVGKAEADVKAALAKRDVALAEVGRVEAMVDFKRIVAPYSGVVTQRDVNVGDLVQLGRGTPLVTVARWDKVRAVIQVPEADAPLIHDGMDLSLTLLGRAMTVKVARTSWALQPGTRTLRVEADIPNADGALRPGTFVTARLTPNLPETWTVPASAVVRLGDLIAMYRVEAGKLVQIPVEIGANDGQFTELRRWRKSTSPAVWIPFTGEERLVESAAGLFDGQAVE